jgi:hypothetical protein
MAKDSIKRIIKDNKNPLKKKAKAGDKSWEKIFHDLNIHSHDFDLSPFPINADQIKDICRGFEGTSEKEVRILCKHDSRENRPQVFIDNNLFLIATKNGYYSIVKGEGYVDVPDITTPIIEFESKLDFNPTTCFIGNSEMQHVDYAYATGLIKEFIGDDSMVLTIRGRKFSPEFNYEINGHQLTTGSVQTEVDGGYEGKDKVVLIEVKNSKTKNTIIRQLYFPYRQWKHHAPNKEIIPLFFEKRGLIYYIWRFQFKDDNDYNSIELVEAKRYKINMME